MKMRFGFRPFVYFLCLSFLLMMNGFPGMVAEAEEPGLPIGMMVSKGQVTFEAREKVWKNVEAHHFPVFQGVKIKAGKGAAVIALADRSQIQVGENSLFSFDQSDRFNLFKGAVAFRIQPNIEMKFRAGNLFIIKSHPFQASKNSSVVPPKSEEIIGSISIHSNGSVTVKSAQGFLSVIGQDHAVLASLSSKESLTVPSLALVAQAGELAIDAEKLVVPETTDRVRSLGLSPWVSAGIVDGLILAGYGLAAVGLGTYSAVQLTGEGKETLCPRMP